MPGEASLYEVSVSEVSNLVGLHPDIGEDLESLLPPSADAVVAAIRVAALDRNLVGDELHVVVHEGPGRRAGPAG